MAPKRKNPVRRVLIVDDHPMMRQGMAQLINNEPDLKVGAEADRGSQAMVALAAQKLDLVLLDISFPDKNGLEIVKDIRALHPGLPILVVSMHDEVLYAERVLRAGARGYIMKQEGGKKMMQAIRQVLDGKIYVSDKISAQILETLSGRRDPPGGSPVQQLSDREFEVFELIGRGKGTREIADHLHLSVKTVEVHRARIKQKLALKSATEVVRCAVRWTEAQSIT